MKRAIIIFLAPNTSGIDVRVASSLLLRPWKWRHGDATETLRNELQERFQAREVTLMNSGRWALATLLQALDLPKDSEVLLQAFTCVSVPAPIQWSGLQPIYVDINETTYTMDPVDLERKITPKSRVLIIQHTFGSPAHLDALLDIAKRHHLIVIEDCAHTIGAKYRGRLLGTFGDATIVSFGRDKALSSVFGGALIIQKSERFHGLQHALGRLQVMPRAWIVQQLLHPIIITTIVRPLYFFAGLGRVALVTFQKLGVLSKAVSEAERQGDVPPFPVGTLPNALAALALSQFHRLDGWNQRRQELSEIYQHALSSLPLILPSVPEGGDPVYLRFPVQMKNREDFTRFCRTHRILLGDWYTPVIAPPHTQFSRIQYAQGSCPIAERVSETIVNLPTHPLLSDNDVERTLSTIRMYASTLHASV